MRRKPTTILFLIIFIFVQQHLFSQEKEKETIGTPSGNASQAYIEIGGPGGFYSLNYDGRLSHSDKGLGIRVGASAIYADGAGVLTFPIGLNYLAGQQGNYFEFGAGATLATSSDVFESGDSETWGWISLGYRRQAYRKKGITWRIAFTPLFGNGFFIPSIGASLGYRF